MKPKFRVIKFYKIQFDENWKLTSTTNQIFTYLSLRKQAVEQVAYKAPTCTVFTNTLVVAGAKSFCVEMLSIFRPYAKALKRETQLNAISFSDKISFTIYINNQSNCYV